MGGFVVSGNSFVFVLFGYVLPASVRKQVRIMHVPTLAMIGWGFFML